MGSKVAALIIGNEILSGRTLDTNSHFLAGICFQHGLSLAEICVIPDDREEIIQAVKKLSTLHRFVFTSGGIGPTHDDITYESIAAAFDRPLLMHEPTVQAMQRMRSANAFPNKGQLRMALLPKPDRVYTTEGLWVPLVQVENVLILPGVPRLFRTILESWFRLHLVEQTMVDLVPKMRLQVQTFWKESQIAEPLSQIQEKVLEAGIEIGSYPKLEPDGSTYVIISLVGPTNCQSLMEKTANDLQVLFEAVRI